MLTPDISDSAAEVVVRRVTGHISMRRPYRGGLSRGAVRLPGTAPYGRHLPGRAQLPLGGEPLRFRSVGRPVPGNTVAAIGACWISCNQAILEFRDKNPDRCTIVRYEDLVTAPEDVTTHVLAFVGASPPPGIRRARFTVSDESRGPGRAGRPSPRGRLWRAPPSGWWAPGAGHRARTTTLTREIS